MTKLSGVKVIDMNSVDDLYQLCFMNAVDQLASLMLVVCLGIAWDVIGMISDMPWC